jgi:hypothetical protein
LFYDQSRVGYTAGPKGLRTQFYWNVNLTMDVRAQGWANFGETGPGIRFHHSSMPPSMFFAVNGVRGVYLRNNAGGRGPVFNDLRAGVWYAFSY